MTTPEAAPELHRTRRLEMVESQLVSRGLRDERVLAAMREVPRERFVAPGAAGDAYGDHPLPIACGQTISQPYVVAWMAELLELRPTDRVLDVGAGSGYAAAVMSRLAAEVFAVERHPELVASAAAVCASLGYGNVRVFVGDGSLGLPGHAPYDAICVACAAPRVPDALVEQLAEGGRLVLPVGTGPEAQELVLVRRLPDGTLAHRSFSGVRFVPLVGAQGFDPDA